MAKPSKAASTRHCRRLRIVAQMLRPAWRGSRADWRRREILACILSAALVWILFGCGGTASFERPGGELERGPGQSHASRGVVVLEHADRSARTGFVGAARIGLRRVPPRPAPAQTMGLQRAAREQKLRAVAGRPARAGLVRFFEHVGGGPPGANAASAHPRACVVATRTARGRAGLAGPDPGWLAHPSRRRRLAPGRLRERLEAGAVRA